MIDHFLALMYIGWAQAAALESVMIGGAKRILGCWSRTCNEAVRGDMVCVDFCVWICVCRSHIESLCVCSVSTSTNACI